jgi:energy-coupling factor transporter ATP-binding protein EcfA2
MRGRLVVLTGASGAGKTTLAQAVKQVAESECEVIFFDSIGVPSAGAMKAWGEGHQPGGAWQRCMTLAWFACIARILATGKSVLFEGQMRMAFIMEAIQTYGLTDVVVILVDCDDATRTERLRTHRGQPDLANEQMMGWAQYLREEALSGHCAVMDTGERDHAECVSMILAYQRGEVAGGREPVKEQLSAKCG